MDTMLKNQLMEDICKLLVNNKCHVAEALEILKDTEQYLLINCVVADNKYWV